MVRYVPPPRGPTDRRSSPFPVHTPRRTFVARRHLPSELSPGSRRSLRVVAAASALVLIPLAAIPASAASVTAKPKLKDRGSHSLPKDIRTDGSFGAVSSVKR